MRSYFRFLLRRRPRFSQTQQQKERVTAIQSRTISGGMTAAALYAVSMTSPTALGAVPADTEAKPHHSKNGKGFINPWESSRDFGFVEIFKKIVW